MTRRAKFRSMACLLSVFSSVLLAEVICRLCFQWDVRLLVDPDHRLERSTAENNSDGIRCDREAIAFPAGDT